MMQSVVNLTSQSGSKGKGGHPSEHVWDPFRVLHARVSCLLSEGDN